MIERKQFKAIVKRDYYNGKKPEIGGYSSYFLQRKDGTIYKEWLTSGISDCKWEIPPKYYDSWKEIYQDGKMYFSSSSRKDSLDKMY